ncbi:MAG TPA: winged helix DNA-binding domain-containing protein [Polyangia bacterium]|nr:winged helix DNA-binding domain-containing protein [Polyangia bacterium]
MPTRSQPPAARAYDPGATDLLRVVQRRLRHQRLAGPPLDDAPAVVGWLVAVQSQDYLGAKWAVAQRTRAVSDAEVEAAFARGTILRTHVLRPTWHFVLPADIRWLLRLTAPRVQAQSATYYRQAGLDVRTLARGDEVLARTLQGGKQLTRDELGAALRTAGLSTDGLRLTLLSMHAELEGAICSGPRRGKQFTYAALDDRAPATRHLPRDQALVTLARRYFASHGPATTHDFAWWSGLKVSDANAAIGALDGELAAMRAGGLTFWVGGPARAPSRRGAASLRLVPNFDEYLISARDHAAVLDARLLRSLGARDSVLANHVVSGSGRIVGDWRRTLKGDAVTVLVTPSAPLEAGDRAALAAEVERYGRFLGLRAVLEIQTPRRSRSAR